MYAELLCRLDAPQINDSPSHMLASPVDQNEKKDDGSKSTLMCSTIRILLRYLAGGQMKGEMNDS